MLVIMQGDQYGIPFQIETVNGIATPELFDDVEIMIGDIRKTYQNGEITFDETRESFMFPITQTESMTLFSSRHMTQIRVKFKSGDVVGIPVGEIELIKSNSREVL